MGKNDRGFSHAQRRAHGLVGDMRQIDQHAETIHLADHVLAEGGQPETAGLVAGSVGEQVRLPGFDVTVYPVIAEPLSLGAVQETVACVSPRVATGAAGASGAVGLGVISEDGSEAGPVPAELVAVTVKVYGVPLVRPVTLHVSGPVVQVQVLPSGADVTV